MSDLQFNKHWRWIAASIVGCLMLAIGFGLIWLTSDSRLHEQQHNLASVTQVQANSIENQLAYPISAVLILGAAIEDQQGRPDNFEQLAATMIDSLGMITNLQLAPAGIIQDIFPRSGHEAAIGRNLFRAGAGDDAANQARRLRRLTIGGPFDLVQGGKALLIRNPVFVSTPEDARPNEFWGFATALVDLDLLVEQVGLSSLADRGILYRLINLSPNARDPVVIQSSAPAAFTAMDLPFTSVNLGNEYYDWQLQVAYAGRGLAPPFLWQSILAVIISAMMLFLLTARLLFEPSRLQALVTQRTRELQIQGEQLRHSQQRLQYIFDNVADGVLSCDRNGTILSANRAIYQMFGYAANDLAGQSLDALLPTRLRETHLNNLQRFRQTGESELIDRGPVELLGLHANGTEFPIELNLKLVTYSDGNTLVATIHDLSELKRTQGLLFQAQKMEATGQLTGGIAHDFNNILSIITGNLDLAQRGAEVDSKLTKWLDQASTAAWRGADLVKQLLAFSSRQSLSPEPLAVDELLEQMGQVLQRVLPESIKFELHSNCGCWVQADRAQFESMLINLANNARDAMPDGGTFSLTSRAVHLHERSDWSQGKFISGEFVQINVADTGPGIDPTIREHIFEPFFSTKSEHGGSGLGLSMVFGFVRQSGGHIELVQNDTEGTLFEIFLPRVAPPDQRPAVDEKDAELLAHTTVLVVEDEEQILSVVRQMLQYSGCTVITATNSNDAQALADAHPETGILLTDVVLAEPCRGTQLASLICAKHPHIQVIFMSGYTEEVMPDEGINRSSFLQKPFLRKDLTAAIQTALKVRKGAAKTSL